MLDRNISGRAAVSLLTAKIRTTPFWVLFYYLFYGFLAELGHLFIFFNNEFAFPVILLVLTHSAFIISNGALQDLCVNAETILSHLSL